VVCVSGLYIFIDVVGCVVVGGVWLVGVWLVGLLYVLIECILVCWVCMMALVWGLFV